MAGLFAGLPVSRYQRALTWYKRLMGSEPAFLPSATEAVWELAGHRYLYIAELPERAGRALLTVFVDDLDDGVGSIRARGIQPAARETYGNGLRKVIYRDPAANKSASAALRPGDWLVRTAGPALRTARPLPAA